MPQDGWTTFFTANSKTFCFHSLSIGMPVRVEEAWSGTDILASLGFLAESRGRVEHSGGGGNPSPGPQMQGLQPAHEDCAWSKRVDNKSKPAIMAISPF